MDSSLITSNRLQTAADVNLIMTEENIRYRDMDENQKREYKKEKEQARAELGQAQFKLRLAMPAT